MKKLFAILTIPFLLTSCFEEEANSQDVNTTTADESQTAEQTAVAFRHPEWTRNANIYEVNVRQYTKEGTLAAFEKHLPRLKEMGVDILWFMPIQPIGEKNRKGTLGSYYSIQDYTAVHPDYGTIDDFKRIVDSAHAMGMKVMLDWVANHTSFDHVWTVNRPDFYTQDSLGNSPIVALDNDGKPTDWTDVADLNFDNQDLHGAMTEAMRYWVLAAGVDGFRCDVAGFVPLEFWEYCIPRLKQSKDDLFFLAEWEDPDYMNMFNMGYAWDFHHKMNQVAKGDTTPVVFDAWLERFDTAFHPDDMMMAFTTNHDENSWNGTVYERMGDAHKVFFVLATTFQNSMPLIYGGQEAGLNHRLEFFEKDEISWENLELTDFYASMLKLKHENPALANGSAGGKQVRIQTNLDDNVYLFYREVEGNRVIVGLNFSDQPVSIEADFSPLEGTYMVYGTDQELPVMADSFKPEVGPYSWFILTQ